MAVVAEGGRKGPLGFLFPLRLLSSSPWKQRFAGSVWSGRLADSMKVDAREGGGRRSHQQAQDLSELCALVRGVEFFALDKTKDSERWLH